MFFSLKVVAEQRDQGRDPGSDLDPDHDPDQSQVLNEKSSDWRYRSLFIGDTIRELKQWRRRRREWERFD